MRSRWYAVEDDTIGGWACATADVPVSAVDTRARDVAVVAHFLDRATAAHIADLHNGWLERETLASNA
jgi:hypothetical protein